MDQESPDAPAQEPVSPPLGAVAARGAGDFERYALIAALTLVVLCLLVWDRWHGDPASGPAPRPDRTLRVRIGGDPVAPAGGSGEAHRANSDLGTAAKPPAPPPPAPAPPPERTYTVKDGDTLGAIASRELGSAARAKDIAALNGIDDPALIKKGSVLKLPAK
jgi:nucleoid-associated protein YgaU